MVQLTKKSVFYGLAIAVLTIASGSSSITTVPPSTTPIVYSVGCCFFDYGTCESVKTWKWSRLNPSFYVPKYHGGFGWTDENGTTWESDVQYVISSETILTLQYFIWSPEAELALGFKDSSSLVTRDLGSLTYQNRSWFSHSLYCDSCCGTEAECYGQFTITPIIPDGSQVAIDVVGQTRFCSATFSNCSFNDPTLCGSISNIQGGYIWQFSGDKYPSYPVPSPGSDFVYFEAINNPTLLRVSLLLETELISVNDCDELSVSYYIYNSYSQYGTNSLGIEFYNVDKDKIEYWYASSETSHNWSGVTIWTPPATGYFVFFANVGLIGTEHVLFAIDYIELIRNNCSEQSVESRNRKKVRFQSKHLTSSRE